MYYSMWQKISSLISSTGIPYAYVYVFVGCITLVVFLGNTSSDPYGTFHLSLNKRPTDKSEESPETEWLNMGYWKDTDIFPDACLALALKTLEAARLKSGSRVLDVGHGSGESLVTLLNHPLVPRPGSLTGITSLPAHHARSKKRMESLGLSEKTSLFLGDAVYRLDATNHPLKPGFREYDAILVLDCAYHFRTRHDFLVQSFASLAPGGRIALADIICRAPWTSLSAGSRFSLMLLRMMPKANCVSLEEYTERMRGIGFQDINVEDVTGEVFPGFLNFLKTRGVGWYLFTRMFRLLVPSLRFGFTSSFMTAIQAVTIRDYQERTDPKPHTVYEIVIDARIQPWSMWRRYSEFDDLHTDLIDATGAAPPAPLPPKHKFSIFRSHSDKALLEERRTGLENYLRAIVSAKDDKWRESPSFKQFLGIPIARGQAAAMKSSPTQFSVMSWLDEHRDVQSRLRDVRADINAREAFSNQGDVNASHKSNVAAKQKLAGVLARIGNLGLGLKELSTGGMSEGELQRRTDMVARLQDDCEKLGKMVTVARMTSSRPEGLSMNSTSSTDREALLGSRGGNALTRVTRVFGAPSTPQETEFTRPLDNLGLVGHQQTQIDQQDQQLSQLTTILQRQRQLGTAIGAEISYQNELLDDLSNDVDRVGTRLVATNRQLHRLG